MGFLGELRTRFIAVSTDERTCPECQEAALEPDYVRSPHEQGHWRGVEADVCPECGYAERRAEPARA